MIGFFHRYSLPLLYLLLLCGNLGISANETQKSVIAFKNEAELLLVGKQTYFLEDENGKLTIAEILKPENQVRFQLNDKNIFTKRASGKTYWLKLNIKNETEKDAWIELGSVFLWYIDYYTEIGGKFSIGTSTGSLRPEINKAYPSNLFLLPLGNSTARQTVYIRIETLRPLTIPIRVGSILSLQKNQSIQDNLLSGCIGFLFCMLLYNIIIMFATREKSYFLYIASVFFGIPSILFWANYTVVSIEEMEGWVVFLNQNPLSFLALPFVFSTLFSIQFMELNKSKVIKYIIRYLILFPLIMISFLDIFDIFPHYYLVWVYQLTIFFLHAFFFGVSIFYWLAKGDRNALLYCFGSGFLMLGIVFFILIVNNILDINVMGYNFLLLGVTLQGLFFPSAIADKINRSKSERERRELLLLEQANVQREMLEKAVKMSSDFSESIIDSLTETIAVIDPFGNIVSVNENWKKFALENGGSESLVQNPFNFNYLKVCEPIDNSTNSSEAENARRGIEAVLAGELATFSLEYPCHSPTEERWFLMQVTPLKGLAKGAVISNLNITDQKKNELLAMQLVSQFEASMESIAEGILIVGIDGKIIKFNRNFVLFFSISKDTLLNASEFDIFRFISNKTKDPQEFLRKTADVIEIKIESSFDYLELNEGLFYERYSKPLLIGDEIFGRVWSFHDITGLKYTQFYLEKNRNFAEAASRAKTEFLATMSHEIRTPLNAIIGFTDLLMNSQLNVSQRQQMKIVMNACNTLLTILNNVLDFSKIEAGKMELFLEKIEIRPLLEETLDVNRFKANEKHIELILTIAPNVPTFLLLDYTRIQQIIMNLVSNALKFTESGEIELKLDFIESNTSEKENQIVFSVRDTGIGISRMNQEKIFEAFSQEDTSTTRKYGGTGLGLTISNKLLYLMDSKLEIESELDRGSRFFFSLNAYSPEADAVLPPLNDLKTNERALNFSPEITDDSAQFSLNDFKISVLVVDDDDINLYLAMSILSQILPLGKIREAHSGKEAIEMFQKEKPDIIFMDIQMPEMNGYTATGEIRKLDTGKRTPIIALTAGIVKEEVAKCFEAGMDDYASKPIVKSTFENLLTKWIMNEK